MSEFPGEGLRKRGSTSKIKRTLVKTYEEAATADKGEAESGIGVELSADVREARWRIEKMEREGCEKATRERSTADVLRV